MSDTKTRIYPAGADLGDTGRISVAEPQDTAWREDDRHPALLAVAGVVAGKVFKLDTTPVTIGRGPECEVCIPEVEISRHHARLETDPDGNLVITDLGSTNGTYVNEVRIRRQVLTDGDRLRVGVSNILKFNYQDNVETAFHESQYKHAVHDDLTGTYNRRHFLDELRHELAFALRRQEPSSVVLFDIDYFKQVNDTYGHAAGDHVLKELSTVIRDNLREEDVLARYGGEEFAIILRGQDEEEAYGFAERVRQLIASTEFVWEGRRIPVTVSLGLASRKGRDLVDSTKLLKAADKNLYAAKCAGRNCTIAPSRRP